MDGQIGEPGKTKSRYCWAGIAALGSSRQLHQTGAGIMDGSGRRLWNTGTQRGSAGASVPGCVWRWERLESQRSFGAEAAVEEMSRVWMGLLGTQGIP